MPRDDLNAPGEDSMRTEVPMSTRKGAGPWVWAFRVAAVLVAACGIAVIVAVRSYSDSAVRAAVHRWIAGSAIPLTTTEPGSGFEDLQPLRQVVADARIVSLGEATHGAHEFQRLKHRILEFLVSEMGFTIFAIEAPWSESLRINDFVLRGEGEAEEVAKSLYYWPWRTEEVLDLITWIREYNSDPTRDEKIKFFGFDMRTTKVPSEYIARYLESVDPAYASSLRQELRNLMIDDFSEEIFARLSPEETGRLGRFVDALLLRFDERKDDYVRDDGDAAWTLARRHAVVLKQAVLFLASSSGMDRQLVRDRSMAENIAWILDNEGNDAKMVAWAHNQHVSKTAGHLDLPTMGSFLHEMFGGEHVAFGLMFGQGTFKAYDLDSMELREFTAELSDDSLDRVLSDAGPPAFVIDLRTPLRFGRVSKWLRTGHYSWTIGAGVSMDKKGVPMVSRREVIPAEEFDAIAFVERASASRVLPP